MYAQEVASTTPGSVPAIILLHGAGGNLDFWTSRFAPYLHQTGIALFAPHYFDRTGTARADLATISDGVHVPMWLETIRAAVRFAASRPQVDPERIVLGGISLGAFLSLAFAAQLSATPGTQDTPLLRAIIEISGGLVEPYRSLANKHFAPTLILHGAQDEVVPLTYATDLAQKLTELNIAHRTEILDGEGHWFSSAALPRMLLAVSSFLEEHLRPKGQRQRAM